MRNSSEAKGKINEVEAAAAGIGVWDCGSPLYDSYELVSLSHVIERHLMKLPSLSGSMRLPSLGGSMRLTARFPHHSDAINVTSSDMAKQSSSATAMTSLGEFLGSKFWKRRRFGEVRGKPKRLRTVLLCFGDHHKAGFANKVDIVKT